MANFLTETAFKMPGTQVNVPRWAVLGAGAGVILILLLSKRQQDAAQAEEDEADAEDAIGGAFDELTDILSNVNDPQGPMEAPGPRGPRRPSEDSDEPYQPAPYIPETAFRTAISYASDQRQKSEEKYGSDPVTYSEPKFTKSTAVITKTISRDVSKYGGEPVITNQITKSFEKGTST